MAQVGFEPMIPVFGRAKSIHAIDRSDTVTATVRSLSKENGVSSAEGLFVAFRGKTGEIGPPRAPDVTPRYLCLRGYLKDQVYKPLKPQPLRGI
jgi:hypothetical protein